MNNFIKSDRAILVAFVLLVFLSRFPFLFAGYGLDGDSWAVAITALRLHDTGQYLVSRLPGYPVHEWLTSLVIGGGPFAVNCLTALVSTLGFLYFALTLRALRFRSVYLASFALAAIPVIYIHSTTAIDYNFALAFILVSLYFVIKDNPVVAGIFLGLAIGSRITSGAMLIPFAIMLTKTTGLRANVWRTVKLTLPALGIGGLVFLPVFIQYGWGFFTYYDVPYPSIPKVLYKFSVEVWGVLGFVALLLSIVLLFLPVRESSQKYLFPRSVNERFVVAWLVAVDLYIIAFLKLPMESGYLIPMIPFVILILGKYLYQRAFNFLCVCLILSPFLFTISPSERFDASSPSPLSFHFNSGGEALVFDVLKGPVISYHSRRENGIKFSESVLEMTDTVSQKSVMVAGRWFNQLVAENGDTLRKNMVFRSYLDEDAVVQYFAKGYHIYYMPKQDYFNQVMRGVDLQVYGAIPFISESRY
ncbi:MAG TPA: hypothetical protein PLU53_13700 [Bacteroidia bacterium]|nr:hypothetical protein [Bacteroidia bacterium]